MSGGEGGAAELSYKEATVQVALEQGCGGETPSLLSQLMPH